MGWTNRGKWAAVRRLHDGTALPTQYNLALVTNAQPPTVKTNLFSELTEIAPGNGYAARGVGLSLDGNDFVDPVQDDTNDLGSIDIRDVTWTAAGGPIPSSGNDARWAVLIDEADQVHYFWDLEADRSIQDGQTLTLHDTRIIIEEPAAP